MSSPFLFDPSNLLVLPETIIGTFRYADWKGAKERGPLGVVLEILGCLSGMNTMAFFVPTAPDKGHGWNQRKVRRLLSSKGIVSWGCGYWRGEMYFRVKRRQMHFAQYVMKREGVPLLHGELTGSRANPKSLVPEPMGAKQRRKGR